MSTVSAGLTLVAGQQQLVSSLQASLIIINHHDDAQDDEPHVLHASKCLDTVTVVWLCSDHDPRRCRGQGTPRRSPAWPGRRCRSRRGWGRRRSCWPRGRDTRSTGSRMRRGRWSDRKSEKRSDNDEEKCRLYKNFKLVQHWKAWSWRWGGRGGWWRIFVWSKEATARRGHIDK